MEIGEDLPPGTVVAHRYTVVSILGQGGSGTVYRVRKDGQRRELALKLMHAQHPEGDSERLRIAREAELLRKLQHPHILALEDYGHTEDGRPFLVFPVLEGRTLKDRLADDGAFDFNNVGRIATQVLRALEKAHSMGIAHRDLKPENIFLTSGVLGEMAQLLDFGLAKPSLDFEAGVTRAGTVLGTPRYMAPEQARAEEVTPSADVYALGLVIGEMITGTPLVDGANDVEIYVKQGSDQPLELPPNVLRSPFGGVVARAVDKNPAVRYRQAGQMLADMRGITERMGQAERPASEADLEATQMIDPSSIQSFSRPSEMSEKLRQAFNKAASKGPATPRQPPGPPPPSSQPPMPSSGPQPSEPQPSQPQPSQHQPQPHSSPSGPWSPAPPSSQRHPGPPPSGPISSAPISSPSSGPTSVPSVIIAAPPSQPHAPSSPPLSSQPPSSSLPPSSLPPSSLPPSSQPQPLSQPHPSSQPQPGPFPSSSGEVAPPRPPGRRMAALLVLFVVMVAAIAVFAVVRLR